MTTFIKNISKLYTPLSGKPYGHIHEIEGVALIINEGKIDSIIQNQNNLPVADETIDADGTTVLPGFIDAHTHPVFWKTREDEFIMRIQGKSYEEIARAGGGIRNSVRRFREADKAQIKEVTRKRISKFLEYGTTTIEAKSGYGLSTKDEIKSLEIINELNNEQPLDLVPTFLGAHEVPDEYQDKRDEYIELIVNEMIPEIAKKKLARFCDVFCEEGVFTVNESKRIFKAAQDFEINARVHADELKGTGGAEMAADIGAVTADHLVKVSDEGIHKMAEKGVIPILLPGTTFFLMKDEYAPARKMIEAGCRVAISTDYNPGSSTTQNMQLIWTIAALKLKMLPQELLWASTLTPAESLGMQDKIGSIEKNKNADLIFLDIPNLNYLPYHYGLNHVLMTLKNGQVVYSKK
jgi:imidazolonepropionase